MTIINPAKNRNYIRSLLMFFCMIFIAGVIYISEYNMFVDARYESKVLKQDIVKLQEQNAELKNSYYQMTDPTRLEKLATDYELILDRQPKYLGSVQ